MIDTILKPLTISILDTVESITLFALLVLTCATLGGVASWYVAATIQNEQYHYYNIPFVLEQSREIGGE